MILGRPLQILMLSGGGYIVSAVYVLWAARRARGDAHAFWFGSARNTTEDVSR